ncbi:MAG TPA: nucleotidyltransferase family protein [Nocardioidaceae bacterium]|nr:nucleotidyltransferase family protein [Nocardioidaceae bacterium]
MSVAGLLLAAGAGRRMGVPKALLRDADGVSMLDRTVDVLFRGGCDSVTVVLGAGAGQARELLDGDGWTADPPVTVVEAADWDEGMGASLRAGLRSLGAGSMSELASPADARREERTGDDVSAALVMLVDLPDVGPAVVRRVLAAGAAPRDLARATYDGEPGHPVLLGRDHWPHVLDVAVGDRGARDYLAGASVRRVECGDLATGRDRDTPTV